MNSTTTAVRSYKIAADKFAFSHGMFPFALLLHDVVAADSAWESFDEQKLRGYFENGFRVFLSRLEEFQSFGQPLTVQKEKELKFMLEALIAAKKTLGE
ncbi:MAG: hypothetical protein Q8P49_03100 [Candidatus Liptonbacteria bacterium]|nr:hypothetical protein [Candidatus Liptonbacteria bacterium]